MILKERIKLKINRRKIMKNDDLHSHSIHIGKVEWNYLRKLALQSKYRTASCAARHAITSWLKLKYPHYKRKFGDDEPTLLITFN